MTGADDGDAWSAARAAEREAVAAVLIADAERGSAEASRSLAGFAAQLLQAGFDLPDSLRAWLCGNLERIEAGNVPPFAPLSRNPRGRAGMSGHREVRIAEHFAQARAKGMTAEEAEAAVGELLGASARTVRAAWARRKDGYPASMGGTGPEPKPSGPLRLPIAKAGKK